MSGRSEMVRIRGPITPQQYMTDPRSALYADDAMHRLGLTPLDVVEVEVLDHHYHATVIDTARDTYRTADPPVFHVWCRR